MFELSPVVLPEPALRVRTPRRRTELSVSSQVAKRFTTCCTPPPAARVFAKTLPVVPRAPRRNSADGGAPGHAGGSRRSAAGESPDATHETSSLTRRTGKGCVVPIPTKKREYPRKGHPLPSYRWLGVMNASPGSRRAPAPACAFQVGRSKRVSCAEPLARSAVSRTALRPLGKQRVIEGFQGPDRPAGHTRTPFHDKLDELDVVMKVTWSRARDHLVREHRNSTRRSRTSCQSRGDKRHGRVRADSERGCRPGTGSRTVRARGDVEGVG